MSQAAETGPRTEERNVDVLIVGAGLSGVGAACQLRRECPDKSVIVLEARDAIGGTWDLFRYPGVRSDSDMFTLGYRFPAVDRRRRRSPTDRASCATSTTLQENSTSRTSSG